MTAAPSPLTAPSTAPRAAEIGAFGIGKRYGSFKALDDVTLTIGRGEFLTLLGPSGSGKTTFLMILAGFEPPTEGRLTMDGRDITGLPAEARAFGMVFQGYALFPHMTAAENIAFPLKVQRRPAAEIRDRVDRMIEVVGLAGHAHKRPSGLSGGQQQRVALARALAYAPPVLLLDEPFSALDKNLRGAMQDEMRRLHRETGTTFVFVTHDQSEALALSTRVAIFNRGRLQQLAPPREIYERPANRFVAEFLGDINLLTVAGRGAGGRHEGAIDGHAITSAAPGEGTVLALRPEHLRLGPTRPEGGNALPVTVRDMTYQGAETRLALAAPGGAALMVLAPTATLAPGLEPGAAAWVGWAPEQGFFLPETSPDGDPR